MEKEDGITFDSFSVPKVSRKGDRASGSFRLVTKADPGLFHRMCKLGVNVQRTLLFYAFQLG